MPSKAVGAQAKKKGKVLLNATGLSNAMDESRLAPADYSSGTDDSTIVSESMIPRRAHGRIERNRGIRDYLRQAPARPKSEESSSVIEPTALVEELSQDESICSDGSSWVYVPCRMKTRGNRRCSFIDRGETADVASAISKSKSFNNGRNERIKQSYSRQHSIADNRGMIESDEFRPSGDEVRGHKRRSMTSRFRGEPESNNRLNDLRRSLSSEAQFGELGYGRGIGGSLTVDRLPKHRDFRNIQKPCSQGIKRRVFDVADKSRKSRSNDLDFSRKKNYSSRSSKSLLPDKRERNCRGRYEDCCDSDDDHDKNDSTIISKKLRSSFVKKKQLSDIESEYVPSLSSNDQQDVSEPDDQLSENREFRKTNPERKPVIERKYVELDERTSQPLPTKNELVKQTKNKSNLKSHRAFVVKPDGSVTSNIGKAFEKTDYGWKRIILEQEMLVVYRVEPQRVLEVKNENFETFIHVLSGSDLKVKVGQEFVRLQEHECDLKVLRGNQFVMKNLSKTETAAILQCAKTNLNY